MNDITWRNVLRQVMKSACMEEKWQVKNLKENNYYSSLVQTNNNKVTKWKKMKMVTCGVARILTWLLDNYKMLG